MIGEVWVVRPGWAILNNQFMIRVAPTYAAGRPEFVEIACAIFVCVGYEILRPISSSMSVCAWADQKGLNIILDVGGA